MIKEENNLDNRKPSKKSWGPACDTAMLFSCLLIGILVFEMCGAGSLVSWVVGGGLVLGAGYWCYKLERRDKENRQKELAWRKGQAKRTTVVTVLILGTTAVLAIAGQASAALGFLLMSTGICVLYLFVYELIEPYTKDRKSAIQLAIKLAITIMIVIAVVAYASRQTQQADPANRVLPTRSE